jgi:uncharacterized Zn finger protein (UPF0148 family)
VADRYCSNCGHALAQHDRSCPNCGSPVHQTAQVPTPEADVTVPPPPVNKPGGALHHRHRQKRQLKRARDQL